MKHIIIGTAGHIDHGKTTLIKALTGRETDRLEEEKKRGISIELGFTYFDLPSGIRAGIIDVPGHERFIKNMLAGVTGMDIVVLVVGADEGVMAQTREHLEILAYTGIKRGVIALTKTDLVDSEWLELAIEDVRDTVQDSFLADAPIFPVSGKTGEGVDALIAALDQLANQLPDRATDTLPRYGIDRVFTISGFGTVVTGTLVSGQLQTGQDAMVFPAGKKVKIRNLQVHDSNVDTAFAGQRVAINLANITKEEIDRGDVLSLPDAMLASSMLDVRLEATDLPFPIENRTRLRLYAGTKEALCRVTLLDTEQLESKQTAYCQLRLEEPVSVQPGDPFIVRLYSPLITIGGGEIIDTDPVKKRKGRTEDAAAVRAMDTADADEALLLRLQEKEKTFPDAVQLARMEGALAETVKSRLLQLQEDGRIRLFDTTDAVTPVSTGFLANLQTRLLDEVSAYHKEYPLRAGMPKEALRSRLLNEARSRVAERILSALLEEAPVRENAGLVAKDDYTPVLTEEQQKAKERILAQAKKEFLPVRPDELGLNANWVPELLSYLIRNGELVRAEEDLLVSAETFEKGIETLTQMLDAQGKITVAETRDALVTNRKVALSLLSAMDARKITRREGDERVRA